MRARRHWRLATMGTGLCLALLVGNGDGPAPQKRAYAQRQAAPASGAQAGTGSVAGEAVDPATQRLLTTLKQELDRSMARLRLKGYEAPYFISYTLRDIESTEVTGKLGAVYSKLTERGRLIRVEVRVGSYELDNTSAEDGEGEGDMLFTRVSKEAPLDEDMDALRGALWMLTDAKYKGALAAYAERRASGVRKVESEDKAASFSKEPPQKAILPRLPFAVNVESMEQLVRAAGARLKPAPVLDGEVKLSGEKQTRYFVSSEGAEVVQHHTLWGAHLMAQGRAKDGMLLTQARDFYSPTAEKLPDTATLCSAMDGLVQDLRLLQEASPNDPYTGPAILMEEAAGVFFHETIGHRLEGERQGNEQEGRTFKGQVGKRVLPEFISISDDPTLPQVTLPSGQVVLLNGTYRYDDEGIAARPVTLIEHGILRDYLKSRAPITGSPRSNGHGRAEGVADPIGRMANLIVKSTRAVPMEKLKAQLLDEVRKQGKPYGLIIRDILGGSTNTQGFGTQSFRGQPTMVYRVDAETGKETLVRGVEMVGTPLSSIAKVMATSDSVGVFNGFCGAESGMVPVSTVAPAILFSEIELQRTQHAAERPPILPPPWREAEGGPTTPGKKKK